MRTIDTRLDGPVLIEPIVRGDERGFFVETYRANVWAGCGIDASFVQDNHSRSRQGVVRGMHFSVGAGQAKLVRCARGHIFDVVVDIRAGSATFGQWEAFSLSDETGRQLFVPIGFAHGFCVVSEVADVIYKCSHYYSDDNERGFAWDDPQVGISWPSGIDLIVSDRDKNAPTLAEISLEFVKAPDA